MTKAVKLQLYYKDDETLSFKQAQEELWKMQREIRAAANRIVQLCWEYNGFESDWKKAHGEYPTKDENREILGKSLSTVIYHKIKQDAPSVITSNLGSTEQAVVARFNALKADIMRGTTSIPSYRRNMAIDLHKRSIKLTFDTDENGKTDWYFELALFSKSEKKALDLPKSSLKFKAVVRSKSKRFVEPILERCYDGIYDICGSKLQYENGKWFLLLCFSFENEKESLVQLEKDSIMGVHIAEHNAVTCVFGNGNKVREIEGGEVQEFSAQVEKRRRSIGIASRKHSKLCGDGRIGHGYHAKMKPLDNIGQKISNFRNTVNHRYSRQIIDWAVQNGCGTIQLEDLTGYATSELEKYKMLKSWSYYDLQTKIEYKAKEYGINVIKVGYRDLQKWCAACQLPSVKAVKDDDGNTSLVCETCGVAYGANDNVAKALCVKDIAKILSKKADPDDEIEN